MNSTVTALKPDEDFECQAKTPPHNNLAEQSVIGAVMLDSECWDEVSAILQPDDFYRAEHRLIFEALRQLAAKYQPMDAVTVSEKLDAMGKLPDAGGLAYLGELVQDSVGANVVAWSEIVRDTSMRRQLIRAGAHLIERGYAKDGSEVPALLDAAEREVMRIGDRQTRGAAGQRISAIVPGTMDKISRRMAGEKCMGVTTGLVKFDERTTGLHPADLLILAARPAMGKTSLAMNFAESAALEQGVPSVIFSMEMPAIQLTQRMVASRGRIDHDHLRKGTVSPEEWARAQKAAQVIQSGSIVIDDTPALSPAELRSRARRMKREHNIGLIVVDYLQLMQIPGCKGNRNDEIAEISRGLKSLAKELSLPIIALSQLNRSVEQRENKRPRMSDLRDSGSIEQDADVVVFIYRDEYYNPDSVDRGVAEIITAKQRNGEIGTDRVAFLGQYMRFDNLTINWLDC